MNMKLWKTRAIFGALGLFAGTGAFAAIILPANQTPFTGTINTVTTAEICRWQHSTSKKKNDFKVDINWGDTTSDLGLTPTKSGGGPRNYHIVASHTYTTCQVFTVTCHIDYKNGTETADDDNQATISSTSTPPTMVISAICPATADALTATVPPESLGTTYNWAIQDAIGNDLTGTITAGQNTPQISFPAASPGTLMFVSITEQVGTCPVKPTATHRAQVDFADVGASHPQHGDVCLLAGNQATLGCGDANYCPDDPVTRNQLALIGLKLKHADDVTPYTPATGTGVFTDVPDTDDFVDWVEAATSAPESWMAACGTNLFCPTDVVTRAQLARFTLLAKSEVPLPATGLIYTDVGATDFAADFIEQMHADFLLLAPPQTLGCFGTQFCPNGAATRAHLAHFLVNAFPTVSDMP